MDTHLFILQLLIAVHISYQGSKSGRKYSFNSLKSLWRYSCPWFLIIHISGKEGSRLSTWRSLAASPGTLSSMRCSMPWVKVGENHHTKYPYSSSCLLVHEQSRPDRDQHVQIVFDNIIAGMEHNFEIQKHVNPAGTSYDLLSIMHYPPTAFSKNGRPTIIARGGAGEEFGTTQEPTETDLYELNTAYQCKTDTGTGVEEETGEES